MLRAGQCYQVYSSIDPNRSLSPSNINICCYSQMPFNMTNYSSTDMDTCDTDEECMRRRHRQTYEQQVTDRDMQYAGNGSDRSER